MTATTSDTASTNASGNGNKTPPKRTMAWAKALATLMDEDISMITEDEDMMNMQDS